VRARTGAVLAALSLAGCAATPAFWSAQGDGGWSGERRREEIGKIARRAGADFAPAAPAPAAEAAAPAPKAIDLATAIAMATSGNRRIALAARDLDASGERVRAARGALLPNLSGSGRYTWYSDALTNSIPAGIVGAAGGGPPPSIVIRESEVGLLNGTVALPIDLSGELHHALAAAQAGYRGERARAWATTINEQLAVVRAYFDVLEAKRLREVAAENVALYQKQLGDARAKFDSGRITKNEVLVVQVALANAEDDARRAELAIARARYALNERIGAPVNAPTEPVDVGERPFAPSIDEALAETSQANPVLQGLLEEQQRLEETAASLGRRRLPRFSTGAGIDYTSTGPVEPRDVSSGFVGFTWSYDASLEAEIAGAKIAADRNKLELERELRELESMVRTTHQAIDERLSALSAAEAAVGQAEENVRIRQSQFDVGRASSEDVLDAQALLSRERAERATALYQAHVRLAELRALMGTGSDAAGRRLEAR